MEYDIHEGNLVEFYTNIIWIFFILLLFKLFLNLCLPSLSIEIWAYCPWNATLDMIADAVDGRPLWYISPSAFLEDLMKDANLMGSQSTSHSQLSDFNVLTHKKNSKYKLIISSMTTLEQFTSIIPCLRGDVQKELQFIGLYSPSYSNERF